MLLVEIDTALWINADDLSYVQDKEHATATGYTTSARLVFSDGHTVNAIGKSATEIAQKIETAEAASDGSEAGNAERRLRR